VRDVLLAIVSDTRYSMLMHPDVAGTLSVTLRGVTVIEALEAIRDVYGYDFKVEGRRITVYAPTLQTRIFTINYPHALRTGSSELRVSSGGLTNGNGGTTQNNNNGNANNNNGNNNNQGQNNGGNNPQTQQGSSGGSRVSTSSKTDYWTELTEAIRSMLGNATGRSVTVSPQAGIMAVRAMPDELRQVSQFLKAAQMAVERQVMLEAKIIEVELRDGYQSGVDWSALRNTGRYTGTMGSVSGSSPNNVLQSGVTYNAPGLPAVTTTVADAVGLPSGVGGLFGLALATDGFQAVLGFLETRGDTQILSSPRIATLNNQKALLKVGTDDYYVTNVSSGSSTSSGTNTTTTAPSVTLTPFFSGIALDVTPQIDDSNNITLYIRPSVTTVTEQTKQVDLGSGGSYRLPLASSSVNESDTVVRIQDGNIVAIGGLMQMESSRKGSGLPGSSDSVFSAVLGNKANSGRKKELVVLIKPTIIRSAEDWEAQTRRTQTALDEMDAVRARVIRLDGTVDK
jgi:MSHA biogenesis protein MshL